MSASARAPQLNTPWAPTANSRTVLTARSGTRAVWRALSLCERVTVWALSLTASLLVTSAASTAYTISAAYGITLTALRRLTPTRPACLVALGFAAGRLLWRVLWRYLYLFLSPIRWPLCLTFTEFTWPWTPPPGRALHNSWAARSLRLLTGPALLLTATGPRNLGKLLFWLPKRLCRRALRGPFRLIPQRTQRLQAWRACRRRPIRRHRSRGFRRLGHRRKQPSHQPRPRVPRRPRPAPPPFSVVGPQNHTTPDTLIALSLLGPYNNLPAASLCAGLWVTTAYLNRGRSTPLPPSPPVVAALAAGLCPHHSNVHHHATEPYGGGGSIPDDQPEDPRSLIDERIMYPFEVKGESRMFEGIITEVAYQGKPGQNPSHIWLVYCPEDKSDNYFVWHPCSAPTLCKNGNPTRGVTSYSLSLKVGLENLLAWRQANGDHIPAGAAAPLISRSSGNKIVAAQLKFLGLKPLAVAGDGDCAFHSVANALGYANTAPPNEPYTTDRVNYLRSAAYAVATDPANNHIRRSADADEVNNIASARRWVGSLAFRCMAIALKRDIIMINGVPRGEEVWTAVFYQSAEWRSTVQRSAIYDTCTNIAAIKDWINGGEPLSPNAPKVDRQPPLFVLWNGTNHFEPLRPVDTADTASPAVEQPWSTVKPRNKKPKPHPGAAALPIDPPINLDPSRLPDAALAKPMAPAAPKPAEKAQKTKPALVSAKSGTASARRPRSVQLKDQHCTIPGCPRSLQPFSTQGLKIHTKRIHSTRAATATEPTAIAATAAAAGRTLAATAARNAAPAPLPSSRTPTEEDWSWAASQHHDWLMCKSHIHVRRQLPQRQKECLATALEVLLTRAQQNDRGAWWLLLALPRLCLPKCPTGLDPKEDAFNVPTLCRMFREGRWEQLLELAMWREEQARQQTRGSRSTDDEARFRAGENLMKVGEYSKAMSRLASTESVMELTEEVMVKLEQLHPSSGALSTEELVLYRSIRSAMLNGFTSPEAEAAAAREATIQAATTATPLPAAQPADPNHIPLPSASPPADSPSQTTPDPALQAPAQNTGRTAHANPDGEDDDPDILKPFQLDVKQLKRAIATAPRASGGAGTGWLYEHLKAVVTTKPDLLPPLCDVLQVVASGRLHPDVARAMGASTLVPLGKEDAGIRPIAIGEVLYRTVGRAACRQKRNDFDSYFKPLQYGVMSPGGAEQILHTITAHLAKHQGHALVSLDSANAFNTVRRGTILETLASTSPDLQCLFPLVAQLYLDDGALHTYDSFGNVRRLRSRSGTRQGDPLAPFLFALAIHPTLKRVQSDHGHHGVVILAYLDDIFVLGPPVHALAAAKDLRSHLATINLLANESKCWTYSPQADNYTVLTAPDASGFMLTECRSPKILGVYIGLDAATKMIAQISNTTKPKALATKLNALKAFAHSGDTRAALALQLLISCAAPSVNYALRACRPADTEGMATLADSLITDAFAAICNIETAELSPASRARAQLHLPQKAGGLGLPSMVTLAKTAYLASWADAGGRICDRWKHLIPDMNALDRMHTDMPPTSEYAMYLYTQRRYCCSTLGLEDMFSKELYFTRSRSKKDVDSPDANATQTWQRRFGAAEAALAKAAIAGSVAQQTGTLEQQQALPLQAWHKSLETDGRAAFLHCVPNAWTRSLSNPQLEFAVRRLLRLKLRNVEGTICACGATLDGFGDHADSCPTLVGMRSNRHDRVNAEGIGAPAKQTGLSPTFEPQGLVEDTNGRPADTCIRSNHGFGRDVTACYDCVGVGTCAATYVQAAARWKGGAMQAAVNRKLRNARRLRGTVDLVVIPMAFESQGGLHPNWRTTYLEWAKLWASKSEAERPRWRQFLMVQSWIARTSLVIQREQYLLIDHMITCGSRRTHGNVRHAHRAPASDDFDNALAAMPPWET